MCVPTSLHTLERLTCFNLHSSVLASRDRSGRSCDRQLLYRTPSFTQIPLKVFSVVLPVLCCFILFSLHLSFAKRKLILLKVLNFSLLRIRQMLPWRIICAIILCHQQWNLEYISAFSLSTPLPSKYSIFNCSLHNSWPLGKWLLSCLVH